MRRLAIMLALIGVAMLARATPGTGKTATRPPFGYDHLLHEGKVNVTGAPALPCTSCHTVDKSGVLKGSPDHKSCFGKCHDAPPSRLSPATKRKLEPAARRVCTRCHAPNTIDAWQRGSRAKLKAFYRPYTIERDYGIKLSHKAHEKPSRQRTGNTAGCKTCHDVPGATRTTRGKGPHAVCRTCHSANTKNIPTMSACTACHKAAYGPASRPNLVTNAFSVGSQFSHRKHVPRLGAKQDCTTCHRTLAETDGIDLPTPKTAVCETCHNGKKAFSTRTPTCRACHTRRDPTRQRTPPSPTRFSHERHRRRGMAAACSKCHTLDARGQPRTASRDHAPCSDAGCHASDFVSAQPKICGACHVAVEPWRALHHDRAPRRITEFGARFSHRLHLAGKKPRVTADCASCHKRRAARRDLALPRGHQGCTTAGCHAVSGGAKPNLTQCTGCHALGILAQRARSRAVAKWSVRARFRHDRHTTDPRSPGTGLSCDSCHTRMTEARGVASAPTPQKRACLACHDGGSAFKITGHRCWRCHSQRRK